MSSMLPILSIDSLAFPSPLNALDEPNGLLALGGDLSYRRLHLAYRSGIFPWFSENEPIMWWSPSPRAIIPVERIYINKTLKKFIKKTRYTVTLNTCFEKVIDYCADAPFREDATWIVPAMKRAYVNLHEQGLAHSIEVWHNDILVGGLYGVCINGYFSGESMFYQAPNASKIALVALAQKLQQLNIKFIDCQITNPFLESMGCLEVSRREFDKLRDDALSINIPSNFWEQQALTFDI